MKKLLLISIALFGCKAETATDEARRFESKLGPVETVSAFYTAMQARDSTLLRTVSNPEWTAKQVSIWDTSKAKESRFVLTKPSYTIDTQFSTAMVSFTIAWPEYADTMWRAPRDQVATLFYDSTAWRVLAIRPKEE